MKREKPRFKWLSVCLRDKKSLIMKKQGQDIIARETDIVRFIRRQLMYGIALKSLFTRVELFLMKNQRKSFVLDGKKLKGDEEDSSDWIPEKIDNEPKS